MRRGGFTTHPVWVIDRILFNGVVSYGEYMEVDQIYQGIEEAPLDNEVKQAVFKVLEENAEELDAYIMRFPVAGFVMGAMNFENDVTQYVMKMIMPVFRDNSVLPANGRDTARHIYKKLGGKNSVTFEITPDK